MRYVYMSCECSKILFFFWVFLINVHTNDDDNNNNNNKKRHVPVSCSCKIMSKYFNSPYVIFLRIMYWIHTTSCLM